MRVIPTSSQEWSRFILFPFKAYSVFALLVFLSVCSHFNPPSSVYSHIGGWIIIGYIISVPVFFVGSLIEFILKSKSAITSFAFGVADIGLLIILPGFFPSK